ncbi:MAG: LysR family transcriptional regulator [Parafilimonas terrae]|nr:LysR family transcriptional regulator [Parafilimonas terrae]
MINLELRHLRSFVCLAEELHFSRAAARLHIVQPALSAQIRSMEGMLGVALFVRGRHKVALTEPGRLLLAEARATLAQAQHSIDVARRAGRGEAGHLRIGYTGAAAYSGLMSRLVRDFRRHAPAVTFGFEESYPTLQREGLLAGRIDIGLMVFLPSLRDGRLAHRVIEHWSLVLAIPETHPLASSERVRPDQLHRQAFVVYAARDGELGGEVLDGIGVLPTVVHRAETVTLLLALVAAGLGLAVVPSGLATGTTTDVAFRPLDLPMPPLAVSAVYDATTASPALENFIRTIP